MDTITWLKETYQEQNLDIPDFNGTPYIDTRPRMEMPDGFSMSIQASIAHYCRPRETRADCNYTHVEIGFPSKTEPLLTPFADKIFGKDVFPMVPIEIVDEIIRKHEIEKTQTQK